MPSTLQLTALPAVSLPLAPRRPFVSDMFNRFRKRQKDEKPRNDPNAPKPKNPLLERYLREKPTAQASGQPQVKQGSLSSDSIFTEAERAPTAPAAAAAASAPKRHEAPITELYPGRDPAAMAMALHPDPRGDARWARKMVIRETKYRGRVQRAVALKRIEREQLMQSGQIKTSVKKLGMLARQIQDKPIEEAILQMRFSKKKAAKKVLEHLEYARDYAVVSRGMGLGEAQGTKGEPVEIELKDGRRKLVEDKTGIYVDQAWVGRGTYGRAWDVRARGRVNILRLPTTSISVLLKEEATRIRLSEEKQQKRANRKVWTQLPDRPIQQQRQHLLW
ncbi:mitochondrial large ribosomal subunit [Diplodia corticola]|uniref:Mitochondrial large ribosomal subunit n=1 Tax=Diplodia corticola TaxID=236234 RepID=A0A1J9RNC1_9PEZI|nr:mitochondrial large ribosomal subunit [Diplodia corticola]OJD34051.1 mitochondrial large ribosomal subunit [Diplodia corticola]